MALEAMKRYCAYQDRCHSEVRTRLLEHQVYGHDLENILAQLITENYLNEERFAQSYVRGKFYLKKWGKIKILQQLKFKDISPYCIKKGMLEIDEDDYYTTAKNLAEAKKKELRQNNRYEVRNKITRYLHQKGYEYDLIKEVIEELESPN